jgi:hypothetical protein
MSRGFKIFVFVISTVLLLGCLGFAVPIDILATFVAGWAFYMARVLPQLKFNWSGVATGMICFVGFACGLHAFLGWFCRHWAERPEIAPTGLKADFDPMPRRRWKRRWTAAVVMLVFVSFATGMAATGIAHQVGWLITETHPLLSSSGGARWAARRAWSMNNLKQIGLAALAFSEQDRPSSTLQTGLGVPFDAKSESMERAKSFPPGYTVNSDGELLHGWMTFLLPFLDKQALFDQLDLTLPWDHSHNLNAFKQEVDAFHNPGFLEKEANRDHQGLSLTNYAGNVHVLGGVRQLTNADITDGTASTIMAGEIAQRFPPWGRPGNWRDSAKAINRSPLGFGGPWRMHGAGAGATFLFLDGSVHFVRETVDPKVLEALGTPRGGEAIATDAY